jgi:hypothetical protein
MTNQDFSRSIDPFKLNLFRQIRSLSTERAKKRIVQKHPNKPKIKLTSLQTELGIKLMNGKIPIGIISINEGLLGLIVATLKCIDINNDLNNIQIKSAVIQTIRFYNLQVIHHNVEKGTKIYKKV